MHFELLALAYAHKNIAKLSLSQMKAVKGFAKFLDARNLTTHAADSRAIELLRKIYDTVPGLIYDFPEIYQEMDAILKTPDRS